MEYLESSRSARKMEPSRTTRYKRTDPRASNIVLGCGRDEWETTNKTIQRQVLNGSNHQGKEVTGDRQMASSRRRGMLESTLSLGSCVNEWHTESKQHYNKHDLRTWGPRSKIQQDSYSWTEDDRRHLTNLRDASHYQVAPSLSHYVKLPPIYARPNGYHQDTPFEPSANGGYNRFGRAKRQGGKLPPVVSDEDDI